MPNDACTRKKQIGNLNWVSEKPLQVSPSSNQAFLDNHKSILQNFENDQKVFKKDNKTKLLFWHCVWRTLI